ncbi:hypothetical protein WMY93_002998 [Mugilogobius chulae]|uniref:Uncharacterized protein n=1 Tax=Mugilogobius chulae TaxID=88201 RepID=A0AAW0Q626_9GOBI
MGTWIAALWPRPSSCTPQPPHAYAQELPGAGLCLGGRAAVKDAISMSESVNAESRGAGTSIDPIAFDQRSLQSISSPGRRSPALPRGTGSSWGSRRSSWNSLGRAPSLKRRDTSGERESLLSGEGEGAGEENVEEDTADNNTDYDLLLLRSCRLLRCALHRD